MRIGTVVGLLLSLISITNVQAQRINDEEQRAFLQNYYATMMIMTPLGPIIPYSDVRVGLEIAYVPPLSLQQQSVILGGQIKAENTNITPVLPRPRLSIRLPNAGPIAFAASLSALPPIPLPMVTVMQAGIDVAAGWRADWGLGLGARGHLNMTQVRADFIPSLQSGPSKDDLFIASAFGGDVGMFYQLPWRYLNWATPFLSAGYAGVRTLTYVGDDGQMVQNPDRSWAGALIAGGLQALFFDKHFEVVIEVSSAIPVFTTVKGKIGYAW